jgi:hypothetical protein
MPGMTRFWTSTTGPPYPSRCAPRVVCRASAQLHKHSLGPPNGCHSIAMSALGTHASSNRTMCILATSRTLTRTGTLIWVIRRDGPSASMANTRPASGLFLGTRSPNQQCGCASRIVEPMALSHGQSPVNALVSSHTRHPARTLSGVLAERCSSEYIAVLAAKQWLYWLSCPHPANHGHGAQVENHALTCRIDKQRMTRQYWQCL